MTKRRKTRSAVVGDETDAENQADCPSGDIKEARDGLRPRSGAERTSTRPRFLDAVPRARNTGLYYESVQMHYDVKRSVKTSKCIMT